MVLVSYSNTPLPKRKNTNLDFVKIKFGFMIIFRVTGLGAGFSSVEMTIKFELSSLQGTNL